ncbi:Ppx/GppA family phosphatase [Iamia sp. SCSIO 61187]|uniref:Ppx/GppA phosphatase family protein n=1 Tax=Iamia sp. SCSIO 61187 TaxID=2722752 RepID=UPI001C6264D6|nr:Ppx/GppA phosphatase family protein [Iamia sp. SCSIO 61187]QYG94585.1 Ppx/GppA family phosphatase [Iamia sp. SCSIO 61187]
MTEVLAAVDVGTNSLHMVIARVVEGDRFDVISREKEQVRLGQGAGDMKELAPEAVERGVAALDRFRRLADAHDAELRAVATSAVREAQDPEVFLERARREAGVEVEVISGVEEARLIHLGVLSALPVFDSRLLLCDIGGGSTELLVGHEGETLASRSLKVGAVRLTNRFFADGSPSKSDVEACRRHVRGALVAFEPAVRQHGFEVAVGSSGTIEQVVRLARRSAGDEAPVRTWNGATATGDEIRAVAAELARAARKGSLDEVEGLDPKRVDIITAGALILEGVVERFGIESLTVSEAALREGVLIDTLHRVRGGSLHHLTDVARRSVRHLASAFDDDPEHSAWVATLALQLHDDLAGPMGLPPDARDHLEAAALLANVGLTVSHDGHHKHSYYVIRHSDRLVGFTDAEIERIALVARYHRKSAPKGRHAEFARLPDDEQDVVRSLAALLRAAIGLDRTHARRVASVRATHDGDVVRIEVTPTVGQDIDLELHTALERSSLLGEVLDAEVQVVRRGEAEAPAVAAGAS